MPPARLYYIPPSSRIPWFELIARTFPDALDCPRCGATLSVIAYITELAVVRKILEHLGLPSAPTELGFEFAEDPDQVRCAHDQDNQPIEPDGAVRDGPCDRWPGGRNGTETTCQCSTDTSGYNCPAETSDSGP